MSLVRSVSRDTSQAISDYLEEATTEGILEGHGMEAEDIIIRTTVYSRGKCRAHSVSIQVAYPSALPRPEK